MQNSNLESFFVGRASFLSYRQKKKKKKKKTFKS